MTIIDQLRYKVNNGVTYSDAVLSGYLENNDNDVNGAAGEIWSDFAGSLVITNYDFSADNASYKLSQVLDFANQQAKYYNSRRKGTSSLWVKDPPEEDTEVTL